MVKSPSVSGPFFFSLAPVYIKLSTLWSVWGRCLQLAFFFFFFFSHSRFLCACLCFCISLFRTGLAYQLFTLGCSSLHHHFFLCYDADEMKRVKYVGHKSCHKVRAHPITYSPRDPCLTRTCPKFVKL